MLSPNRYAIGYTIELKRDLDLFLKTQKLNLNTTDILYENEIWDGPLTGVCLWNARKYYYYAVEMHSIEYKREKGLRRYFLIRLTEEQLRNEENLHKEFIKYVESYPRVLEGISSTHKGAEWDKYLEACNKYPDQIIFDDQIVGWFEW
jgi:hypothetical protein